jgi:hypothetical protein
LSVPSSSWWWIAWIWCFAHILNGFNVNIAVKQYRIVEFTVILSNFMFTALVWSSWWFNRNCKIKYYNGLGEGRNHIYRDFYSYFYMSRFTKSSRVALSTENSSSYLSPFIRRQNASCIFKLMLEQPGQPFLCKIPTAHNALKFLTYIWPATPTGDDGGRWIWYTLLAIWSPT